MRPSALVVLACVGMRSLLPEGVFLLCQAARLFSQAPHDMVLASGVSHSEDASFAVQTGFFDHVAMQALGSYPQCCGFFCLVFF